MKCPVDSTTLVMAERSGVEIDYCPECRGIWLDRGELDKIIQRTTGDDPHNQESERRREHDHEDEHEHKDHHHEDNERGYGDKKKRRSSFIGDIFGGLGGD